jgi:SPP1 gp7 family putative phage head morphogenesis protein
MAQLHELGLWSRKVKKSGPAARFNAEVLPAEIVTWVRSNLDECWNPQAVFDAARRWVRAGEPQGIGATEAESQMFWQDFDALPENTREAWLNSYMAAAWASLQGRLTEDMTDDELTAILAQHHDEIVNTWIGTAEAPGPLYELALAGMTSGEKTLTLGTATKSQRATPSVGVSFDLLNQQALDWVRQYSFDLIKGIDADTVNLVRKAIDTGIAEGQSLDQIAAALGETFTDPARARKIAATESLKAYNQSAFQRWQSAGVTQAEWTTVQDAHVCPICRRLNGQVADINVGWTDPDTGVVYRDLAHVGCRCPKKPRLS